MWYSREDRSASVFTAAQHAESRHGDGERRRLPALCILFYMGGVIAPLVEQGAVCVMEKLPRFLGGTPVYQLPDAPVCFLDGGRGAPQAADTLETLYALGVRQVLTAGMCGAFSEQAGVGDRILPDKAFIEEGTSLHYAEPRLFSTPSGAFLEKVRRWFPEGKCMDGRGTPRRAPSSEELSSTGRIM